METNPREVIDREQNEVEPANVRIDWLASYPRSGNTWTRFLLTYGVFGESARSWNIDVNRACVDVHYWVSRLQETADARSGTDREIAKALQSEVVHLRKHWPHGDSNFILKTHFKNCTEHPLHNQTQRVIYLTRHPLLVARSSHAYHRMLGLESRSLSEYLEEFIDFGGDPRMIRQGFGTWEENRKSWLVGSPYPVLEIHFEDLKAHTQGQLSNMLDFLRLDSRPENSRQATELASRSRLSELEHEARSEGEFRAGAHTVSDDGRTINQGAAEPTQQLSSQLLDKFRRTWARAMDEAGYPMP